jgi:hydroxymethylpyrimidine/phosphomethylpyrimidine kinase
MKVALSIAGSDSGGGAGLQADLKTFAAFGVHGASAVTAVTAQGAEAVLGIVTLDPAFVSAQIEAVAADLGVNAVKTGMLGNAAIVKRVAETLGRLRLPNIVVDPVMAATGGEALYDGDMGAWGALLPLARVLTPNLLEAEALLGHPVRDLQTMRTSARELRRLGPHVVVLKGGHLSGDAVDVYFDGESLEELAAPRIPIQKTHGTGCTFASAIAAGLALGAHPLEAVRSAKDYLGAALSHAFSLGPGRAFLGHFPGKDGQGWC